MPCEPGRRDRPWRRRGSGPPRARSRSRSSSRSAGTPVGASAGPTRSARVRIAAASDPACGSVRANAPSASPGSIAGSQRACCSSRAPGHDRVLRQDVDRERHRHRHVGRAQLLHDQRPAEVREPGPADRLRERRRGQAERAHLGEQRAVVALRLVALDRARGDLALGELAGGRLEQPLLVGQRRPTRARIAAWTTQPVEPRQPSPLEVLPGLVDVMQRMDDSLVTDLHRRVVVWNVAAERQYGIPAEDAVGRRSTRCSTRPSWARARARPAPGPWP